MVNRTGATMRARYNRHIVDAEAAKAYSRKGMVKDMGRRMEEFEEKMGEAGYPVGEWKRRVGEAQYKVCLEELDSKEELGEFLRERTVEELREL